MLRIPVHGSWTFGDHILSPSVFVLVIMWFLSHHSQEGTPLLRRQCQSAHLVDMYCPS